MGMLSFRWPWRPRPVPDVLGEASPPAADAVRPMPVALPPPGAPLLPLRSMGARERRVALLRVVIDPTLAWMATMGVPTGDRARVMLLAIAGQESAAMARRQVPVAHAMGLWQFERGGGVAGVLAHRASMDLAGRICAARQVQPATSAVHAALEHDDVLACAFSRLLLWTDPLPLPEVGQEDDAWRYYVRVWRPGAYLKPPFSLRNLPPPSDRWPANYRQAAGLVRE